MSTTPFVHLHCHSHYSLLDGAGPLDRLLNRAKELGMNSLALTDHGNLFGALEFYETAQTVGIKPIIGYEAYVAPGSRFHKDASSMKEASFHLTLLAKDVVGYKNLLKLASSAFLEGFYFRPRIDKNILEAHSEGLICLSGCASSEFNRALIGSAEPDLEKAKDVASWFARVFPDRYYIEIQNNGLEIQQVGMEASLDVANRMGLPVVATSDVHYVNREDSVAQDILLCINTGKFRTDTKRMRMDTNEFFLRSAEEMYQAFPGHEDTVRRSQEIADQVDIQIELGKRNFPVYTPPGGMSSEDYLRELCIEGLKRKYAKNPKRLIDGELSQEVMDRLNRELGVICKLGFPNYFLIVWDFVNFARSRGIEATARGSGVGSLVAFALDLSRVCPLEYDLLFERFLDINRREPPDIDIDFCQVRRGEVIQYVKERYGHENVAQIGTFGTMAARAAIRDVGRALGLPIPRVNAVVAMVPEQLGIELAEALETSADLKKAYDGDPEVKELLDLAMSIEGLARNVGTHAAAVVIADKPLNEYLPLQRVQGKEEVITQWAMAQVEHAGLLKMDFLGLRNLTILTKVVDLIEQTTGQRVNPYEFPVDDAETFALLCRGETKGVFQLESGGIRDLLQRMKPSHFRDIIATNALYRPGPLEGGMVDEYIEVKHGRKKPEYKHPVMEEVLGETHGIMVYQEQVMRILNRLGGIELAAAYTCIKAISKKKAALIEKNKEQFVKGSQEKGLTQQEAEELFGLIEKFAGYGFNKCVVGDTEIIHALSGRRTTVGELFRSKRPFVVHSLGEDGRLRPRRVTDVVWNGRKRVYKLTTRQGKTLVATANHPLRTLDGWTNLGDLKPGDRIAAPRQLRIYSTRRLSRAYASSASEARTAWYDDSCHVSRHAMPCRPDRFDDSSASDILWDTVASIEPQGIEDTYDLTVEGDHNFVADGLVVHNSHSTAYALVAYMTAYLKAHYPVEFMAALLTSDIPGRNFTKKDSLVEHIEDCQRMKIEVVAPDVNTSEFEFAVRDGKIFYGLAAIKGCGSAGETIVATRRKKGPFRSIFDFCERLDTGTVNRGAIESLIKAGAFDSLSANRAQLFQVIDRALQSGASAAADRRSGQKGLFGDENEEDQKATVAAALPDIPEWEPRDKLSKEKEVLGFYLTSHPLAEHEQLLSTYCSHNSVEAAALSHRTEVMLGGMLAAIKIAHTKNPQPGKPSKYAMFDLEDMQGIMRCIVWPEQYAQFGELVQPDAILMVLGAIDKRPGSEEANLIVNELIPLDQAQARYTRGVMIRLFEQLHGAKALEQLYEILRGYPGQCELQLVLSLVDGTRVPMTCKTRIENNPEMRRRVEDLLGPGNFRLLAAPVTSNKSGGKSNGKSYGRGGNGRGEH